MKTNRTWVHRMLRTAAILACILLPVSGIAADFSVNEQLLRAAENGSPEQLKTLLAKGGDVNAKDKDGQTALMHAAKGERPGHQRAVEFLIEKGADVNAKNRYGQTALMRAAHNGHAAMVRLLLEKGADVNAKDWKDMTALNLAQDGHHKEIVELLKAHGAKV